LCGTQPASLPADEVERIVEYQRMRNKPDLNKDKPDTTGGTDGCLEKKRMRFLC
jgi:hypothetical protein